MRLRHLALPAAAGLTLLAIPFAPVAVAAPTCDASVSSCAELFRFTGGPQTFTVPAGVSTIAVAIGGARGGNGLDEGEGTPSGGYGGALDAIVPVTAGEVLTLVVGGKGGDASFVDTGTDADTAATVPDPAPGGYGGGGAGTSASDGPSGGGGGGSFLFAGDTLLLAVGGGGGAGYTGVGDTVANGGDGGASAAGTAGAGANGGGAASTTAGGAAGAGDDGAAGSGPASGPAAFGVGGSSAGQCPAGGGGGGLFGGGSGGCVIAQQTKAAAKSGVVRPAAAAAATSATAATPSATADADDDPLPLANSGGGGGGAGFLGEGVSQVAALGDATNTEDNGVIALAYTSAPTTTTLTSGVTTLAPGQDATLEAEVDGPALQVADPTDPESPAAKAAAAAFGTPAKALAVPSQPAAPGSTLTPGTACGTTACTVTFFVNGAPLGDPIAVDPKTGVATVIFTAGSDLGDRTITARYDGNLYYLQSTSAPLTLTVAGLADTGPNDVVPMLGVSAALLLAGAGLVATGRRRPQAGSHRLV